MKRRTRLILLILGSGLIGAVLGPVLTFAVGALPDHFGPADFFSMMMLAALLVGSPFGAAFGLLFGWGFSRESWLLRSRSVHGTTALLAGAAVGALVPGYLNGMDYLTRSGGGGFFTVKPLLIGGCSAGAICGFLIAWVLRKFLPPSSVAP